MSSPAPAAQLPETSPAASLTAGRRVAAWSIAALADLVQWIGFPIFGEGFASPANNALDVVVAAALTYLVGFHWSFLPSLVVEALPVADVAPTWTAAVFLALRARNR